MREIYFNVEECTEDELFQLKNDIFYADYDEISKDILDKIKDLQYPEEIPNELIFKIFAGVLFIDEDFWCNTKDEKED